MDRDEALRLLRGGEEEVREWNRRRAAVEEIPHLVGAILHSANLIEANFSESDLSGAHLSSANLSRADLSGANLRGAHLIEADLSRADLSGADLSGANLRGAHLSGANLSRAKLIESDFIGTYLIEANLSGANLSRANLSLARLIRCKLDDAIFDEANMTECHVLETIGRPKPPRLLRFQDRSPLTDEDAWNFFNPPAIVEIYLTEVLTDEELGAFRFHLGDIRRQGVGIGVHLTGEHEESGGTALRFQAPTYAEIYDVLPVLLKPFRMSRAIDWPKTYEDLPEHERGAVLTALAKVEVKDPTGRWLFAERLAQAFGCFPVAQIKYIRDNRRLDVRGVRIEVAINQAIYEKLAEPPRRSQLVTKQQIINLLAGESPRIALEDHSMDSEVTIGGNVIGSAVGSGSTVNARDITAFINTVDQTTDLKPELKRVLVEARKALESSSLAGADKDDAADDLGKLTDEIQRPEPQPGRIKRLFDGIKQLAPDVASILSSAAKIGELIKG